MLCVTEFRLRLTVWSLIDATCVYIRAPKFADGRGLDFSPDGKFLAFVRRERCADSILVVDARDWTVASAFAVATEDLADARWSPDSTSIAVHDAPHAYALILYAPDGRVLRDFGPTSAGRRRRSRGDAANAAADAAGVRCQRWSRGASFLAAGGRDRRCRVLNHVSWRAFADLAHADRVVAPATVAVYEETEERAGPTRTSRADENADPADDSGEWWDDALDGDDGEDAARVKLKRARDATRREKDLESGALVPKYVVRALPASLPIDDDDGSRDDDAGVERFVVRGVSRGVVPRRPLFGDVRRADVARGVDLGHGEYRALRCFSADATRRGVRVGPARESARRRHRVGTRVRVVAGGRVVRADPPTRLHGEDPELEPRGGLVPARGYRDVLLRVHGVEQRAYGS